jgi:pyruvate/2-oxoglutarate dehydrogenase complex dihydrolipoamide acyltransferase (E2) component
MKYLDARKEAPKESIVDKGMENKMQRGSRADQRGGNEKTNPEDLVSSPSRSQGRNIAQGVQKLASELSVDLASVKGTGANGEITEKDVRYAKQQENKQD